jgi:hypothetical protein
MKRSDTARSVRLNNEEKLLIKEALDFINVRNMMLKSGQRNKSYLSYLNKNIRLANKLKKKMPLVINGRLPQAQKGAAK